LSSPARRPIERQGSLLAYLNEAGEATVEQLSRELGASEVSIRRDLEALGQQGLVRRVRGGARSIARPGQVSVFEARLRTNTAAKAAIGRLAATLVQPGETVLLDSGTTVLDLARHLPASLLGKGGLTVVTRSLSIAAEFRRHSGVRLIVLGGLYLHEFDTFVGDQVDSALRTLHVGTLFIGTDGVGATRGLTTDNALEAPLYRAMAGVAGRVIVLADATKIGVEKLQATVPLEGIHTFITDAAAPAGFVDLLQGLGVQVLIASMR
jgi:DeoR/GlpR family transcriptional regulator of sugar metabolism